MLVDMYGRKMLNTKEAKELRDSKMKEFVIKHHKALEQWFQEKGIHTPPPIMWDEQRREFYWVD